MATGDPIALWLLPLLGLIGFAAAYTLLAAAGLGGDQKRAARVFLETATPGGPVFWSALRFFGFGVRGGTGSVGLVPAAASGVTYAVVAWPFTQWPLGRGLEGPQHQACDVTARVCGVTLLVFLIAAGAAVIAHYL